MRAALNELATIAPDWLRSAAPQAWYKRYALRIEDSRLPQAAAKREAYARAVGEDGFALLDRLGRPEAPEGLGRLPKIEVLRRVWERHFVRGPTEPPAGGGSVRLRGKDDPPPSAEPVEFPYDSEARYRTRSGTSWTGYVVQLSETCEDDSVNLLTHAMTTLATVHEARCTATIHRALADKGLAPGEHLVDAAYIDAELLVRSREDLGIDLVGPPRVNPSWQGKVEGGYTIDRFEVDWDASGCAARKASSPRPGAGKLTTPATPYVSVTFRQADCGACLARALCTRAEHRARHLKLQRRAEHEALKAAAPARDRGKGGAATPGGPGSRAPSRKACVPSGSAAAAIAGWPRPTCSTWQPRPRSISTASRLGSALLRAPPPVPPASPPSPLEPTSPTVSGRL